MYKVGDKVETYKGIQDVTCSRVKVVKGEIRGGYGDIVTIRLDEKWDRAGSWAGFHIKDLLATDTLRLKVGDKVRTSGGRYGVIVSGVHTAGYKPVHCPGSSVYNYTLEELIKVDDPDEGGQRGQCGMWSFSATKDTFDGARVIRELVETDADYAVVEVNGRRFGLLHDSVARRAVKLQVYKLAGQDWSASPVVDFDLRPRPEVRFGDAPYGYRYAFHEGDGVTMQELAEMVKELEGLEKKAAEEARKRAEAVVATVTWAKADK